MAGVIINVADGPEGGRHACVKRGELEMNPRQLQESSESKQSVDVSPTIEAAWA